MSDPYLRVHLTDGDTIDLTEQDPIEAWAASLATEGAAIHGRHVGGNECAIPTRSILWAEIIEPEENGQ